MRTALCFVIALMCCFACVACLANDCIRTIGVTGQPAPGADAVFDRFGGADINASGQVAFNAYLRGVNVTNYNRAGIWVNERNGNNTAVIEPGNGPYSVAINDVGSLLYRGPHELAYGLFSIDSSGNSKLITHNGHDQTQSNTELVAFDGTVGTQGGVAIYRAEAAALLAQSGPAIEDPSGKHFINFTHILLNDAGQVFFQTQLASPPFDRGFRTSALYYAQPNGTVKRIAAEEDTLITDRGQFAVNGVYPYDLNNAGDMVFNATLNGGSMLVMQSNQENRVLISEGDWIDDEQIMVVGPAALSPAGEIAFQAGMIGGEAIPNQTSMILKRSSDAELNVIARTDTPAPGSKAGQHFGRFGGQAMALRINAHGQVAFGGPLIDPSTRELSGFGIWAEDRNGLLRSVVQSGDVLDVDDGPGIDYRTVLAGEFSGYGLTFTAIGGGNQNGLPSAFNDRGELVFHATFTDGTSGLFVSSIAAVPEPSALVLMAIVVAALTANLRFAILLP